MSPKLSIFPTVISGLHSLVSHVGKRSVESPKMTKIIGLFLIHLASISANILPEQCYANNSDPYLYFASKTSYFNVEKDEAKSIEVEGKAFRHFHFHEKNLFRHLFEMVSDRLV